MDFLVPSRKPRFLLCIAPQDVPCLSSYIQGHTGRQSAFLNTRSTISLGLIKICDLESCACQTHFPLVAIVGLVMKAGVLVFLLALFRSPQVEFSMRTLAIVEEDVVGHGVPKMFEAFVAVMGQFLPLHGAEERLGHRIVMGSPGIGK